MTTEQDARAEESQGATKQPNPNPEAESGADKNSVSPKRPEPKPQAERAELPKTPYAVVGDGDTDEVRLSRTRPGYTRKSLTVHHLQRRLEELGFGVLKPEDGRMGTMTQEAVAKWQNANKFPGGPLTSEQFKALFKGDPNVTVVLDIPGE